MDIRLGNGLVPTKQQAIIKANYEPDYWWHMASLDCMS